MSSFVTVDEPVVSASLIARAKKRKVVRVGIALWDVIGDSKLGDHYDSYEVKGGEDEPLVCACWSHAKGEYRARRSCSHALAVQLALAGEHEFIDDFTGSTVEREEDDEIAEPVVIEPEVAASVDDPDDGEAAGPDQDVSLEGHSGFDPTDLDYDLIPHPRDCKLDPNEPPMPSQYEEFRPHQWPAIVETVEHLRRGKKVVFVSAATGCLSGDTIIPINRGGASKDVRLDHLVHKFNGGRGNKSSGGEGKSGKKWDQSIPTTVRRAEMVPTWGVACKLVPLVRAVESGIKTTYTLTTDTGRSIRATADHRFATNGGTMVPLSELEVGDEILVDVGKGNSGTQKNGWYKVIEGLVNHPQRGERPYRQPTHRLVVEAHMNSLPFAWYVAILRDKDAPVNGLMFLDPSDVVHHHNHDKQDNRLSNLRVVERRAHNQLHGLEGAWANVANRVGVERVVSVEEYGEEPTYDLTVLDDPHNFIANGFVVENSGKTLIGEAVRRLMGTQAIYTATTKTLQDQVMRDFGEYARTIKGRSNYQTLDRPDLTADDCTKAPKSIPACPGCSSWGRGSSFGVDDDEVGGRQMHCTWCHPVKNCPYQIAKDKAWTSRLAVLNLAYFLNETQAFNSKFYGWPLVLLDEADQLERQLMSFVSVEVRPARRKELGIGLPKKTVEDDWVRWIEDEVIPATRAKLKSLGAQQSLGLGDEEVREARRKKSLRAFLANMKTLVELVEVEVDGEIQSLPRVTANWVLDGVEKPIWAKDWDESKVTATFKPVYVADEAERVLWGRGGQFVLFSATFVSVDHTAKMLGLEPEDYAHVEVDYSFPVTRRPIVPRTVASVTYKTKKDAYPKLGAEVATIMQEHPDERILVHTVSYDLTKAVLQTLNREGLGKRVHTYFNAGERTRAIAEYEANQDAVILAPSLDRGVDFKDDLCRIIVVCKIPYPYQDKQVKARLHGGGREGQSWYAIESIRTLCQMTGRGMRSEEDWCLTFLLDEQFRVLWKKNRRLFPSWWSDAVVWDVNDPRWRDAVVIGRNL